jgi:hypothetical protein
MAQLQMKYVPDTRKVFEKVEPAAQPPEIAAMKAVGSLIVAADVRRLRLNLRYLIYDLRITP